MTMNDVVKTFELSSLFTGFNDLIQSKIVNILSRKRTYDFTRNRNMNFYSLIYYFIFRNKETTNSELTQFYCAIDKFEKRISKQALNKAIRKLNPGVFRYLIIEFSRLFYSSSLVKRHKGYLILAEDGTYAEIPYNVYNIMDFQFVTNKQVHDMFDVKKVQSKAGGLYDVCNGFFVDFSLRPATCSETTLAFEHLYHMSGLFENEKLIYLADRYYGSAELISFLESNGYSYCIRGKGYFYKKEVAAMSSDDEWITVNVDEKWRNRFKFSPEAKDYREKNPEMKIRVVKKKLDYTDQNGESQTICLLFFTNLKESEFSSSEIIELYSKRWDIEVSYKTLKTAEEMERHISSDGDVARNCIYGKVMFHNFLGIIRKEFNSVMEKATKEDERLYVVNITQLHEMFYEGNFLKDFMDKRMTGIRSKIESIWKLINKIKVPVRPNRHYKRWNRFVKSAPSYRFRLDGRNHPKLRRYKGGLMTMAP